jgi:hypothetical protein
MPAGAVTVVLALIFVGALVWLVRRQRLQSMRFRRFMEEKYRQYKFLEQARVRNDEEANLEGNRGSKGLTDILKEKTQRFLETPSVAFHFADIEQIQTFYNDFFREPTIESLVSEITQELNADVKGTIPQVLEAKLGGKDVGKWISNIKLPDTTLSGMFVRYQRETIKKGQVTIGLEEVDIELNDLQEFDDAVGELAKKFSLLLAPELVDNTRASLKQKAAERTLVRLENATGWLLVEGRFRITRQDEFYRCTYTHPVGEYLPEADGPVTLSFLLDSSKVENRVSGNYAQSLEKLIPLKVYGKVWQPIDRGRRSWDLQITPLAVY